MAVERVPPDGIDRFVREALENPDRTQPLVVISVERHTSHPMVSPERVAGRLGDLAQVVALADGNAAWALSQRVGGLLSCYWGAVRLYWPGFDSKTSRAYEHPVWLAQRIRATSPEEVVEEIAEAISRRQGKAPEEDAGSPPSSQVEPLEEGAAGEERRRNAAYETLIEQLKASVEEQAARISEIEGERDAANERTATAERERDEAEEEREAANTRIEDLEQERDELRDRLESDGGEEDDDLAAAREERDQEHERAEKAEAKLERAREGRRKDRENFDIEREKLKKKRDDAVADLNKQIKENEIRLNGRIERAVEQKDAAKEERDNEREKVSGLQAEIDRLNTILEANGSTSTDRIGSQPEQADQEQKTSERHLQELSDLRDQIDTLEKDKSQLQGVIRHMQATAPTSGPSPEPVDSLPDGSVSFAFPYTVKGFSIEDCDPAEMLALMKNLAQRSQMTWQQMQDAPHTGAGTEKIAPGQISAIPAGVPEDNLLVLRTGKRGRVVGYRDGDVFVVVWVDPKHKLYDG